MARRGAGSCREAPAPATGPRWADKVRFKRRPSMEMAHRAGPEMKPELQALPRKSQHDNPRRARPSHLGTAIPRGTKMPRCSGHGGGACDDRAIGRGGRLAVGRLHHRRHLRTNKQTSGGFRVKAGPRGRAARANVRRIHHRCGCASKAGREPCRPDERARPRGGAWVGWGRACATIGTFCTKTGCARGAAAPICSVMTCEEHL